MSASFLGISTCVLISYGKVSGVIQVYVCCSRCHELLCIKMHIERYTTAAIEKLIYL